jgi:predicted RNA-binding protein YlxR (DUF448 family)
VRFGLAEGKLVPATPGQPGRTAYTCPRLACFERAVSRRGFARTLRSAVEIDPALSRLYTEHHG